MPNMKDFDDMQQLWQQSQPKTAGTAQETVRKIVQQQQKERRKMLMNTLILLLTFFYILFVSFYYPFVSLSTHLGLVLILFAILAAVLANSRMIVLLYRNLIRADTDNKTMLANMELYQRRQHFFHSYFLSAYYILLTTGIMLYMYEQTQNGGLSRLLIYAITLGWIAFAWWYIRPRRIREQKERITAIIDRIKSLEKEIGDE